MRTTINTLFQDCLKKNGRRTALVGKDHHGKAKGYDSITYDRLAAMVRGLALGLRELGVKKGASVGLISENRPEWAVADLGILHAGAVSVAFFPTLPAGQVEYGLDDSGASLVILSNKKQLDKVLPWMRAAPAERSIIIMDGEAVDVPGVLSFSEVMDRGAALKTADFTALWKSPAPEDMAAIIYTSGTTGNPMGAVLTHRNVVASITAAEDAVAFGAGDTIVSFLPLNHVLARLADHYLPLSIGATVAYAATSREIRGVVMDMRPQYMTLVPRVLDMYREGILGEVNKSSPLKKRIFNLFFSAGLECSKGLEEKSGISLIKKIIWKIGDKRIFGNIRERLGLGALRFFISGGAPLSAETERFFRVLGIKVLEGYGLTETAALVSVNRPGRAVPGTVGPPVKGVEVKFSHGGEILVKGANIMAGYWRRPEQTAAAIDAEGWLNTGDLGEFDEAGNLRIRGRSKEIMVLTTGKNVAPVPIEESLGESPYISQIIIAGDNRNSVTALIVPEFGRVREWLSAKGGEAGASDEEVAGNPRVKELFRGELKRLSGGMADFERVKRFALLKTDFTVEHGELTPTLKLRRKIIFEKYAEVLESLYR